MTSSPPLTPPMLTASIVLHKTDLRHVTATVEALDRAVATLALPFRVPVMVVDQSLDEDYAERVSLQLDACDAAAIAPQLLVHDRNRGYGAGHNRALVALGELPQVQEVVARSAELRVSEYMPAKSVHLILNPDVELAADALEVGLRALAADDAAILVAPFSYTPSGEREYLAKAYPSVRALALRAFAPQWLRRVFDRELARYELRHLDASTEPAEIVLASGACMLVRRQALDVVGGFDESFFLYFEDYDLSLRLARWGRLLQVPGMRIVHHGGGAARKGWRHIRWFASGGWRFFRRWGWRCW
ncbi:MAG: glycosyltransferase family 2 protein [Halieaceae bacterium]|nr:glycosyltransferase family 2 protein [Halieaceae bacterium]